MEWTDIHDPKDEFDFHVEWTLVGSEYNPEEIQDLINVEGVAAMVHIVNEHFKLISDHAALFMTHVGGRRAVVAAH